MRERKYLGSYQFGNVFLEGVLNDMGAEMQPGCTAKKNSWPLNWDKAKRQYGIGKNEADGTKHRFHLSRTVAVCDWLKRSVLVCFGGRNYGCLSFSIFVVFMMPAVLLVARKT